MKNEIQQECYKTADKIIGIIDELEFSTKKVPSYPNLLRDLISIEVRRNINQVTTMFFNNVTDNPIVETEIPNTEKNEGGCCGGESEDCGCK